VAAVAGLSVLRSVAVFVPAGSASNLAWVSTLRVLGVPDAESTSAAFVTIERAKEVCWIVIGYLVVAMLRRDPKNNALAPPAASGAI
jgi:hypothetical protein